MILLAAAVKTPLTVTIIKICFYLHVPFLTNDFVDSHFTFLKGLLLDKWMLLKSILNLCVLKVLISLVKIIIIKLLLLFFLMLMLRAFDILRRINLPLVFITCGRLSIICITRRIKNIWMDCCYCCGFLFSFFSSSITHIFRMLKIYI